MFRAAAILLCATLLTSCASPRILAPAQATTMPDVFPSIPEVVAAHGVAKLALSVVLDPVTGEPTFEYEGRSGIAPTIRVRPGDEIAMTLRNDAKPMNGKPNDVNIHFHGLTVSPRSPQDDVLMTLARPGQVLHYRLRIPADHEPGLYWYHPHAHGESYYEVTDGMSGAIVVEGVQDHLPSLRRIRERVLVLRDTPASANYVDADMPIAGMAGMHGHAPVARRASTGGKACRAEAGLHPTVNGLTGPRIGIRPGEAQFFRVVNASAGRYFDLVADGATIELVGRDGFPLDAYPGAAAHRRVSHLFIPPAGRVEFVLTAPGHATMLRTLCVDTGSAGDANPANDLAELVDPASIFPEAAGAEPKPAREQPLVVGRSLPRNWYSRPLPPPAATRHIRFSEDDRGFYIDGHAFSMDDPPSVVAHSGTVERWILDNDTDEAHDFHIHQVHFVEDSVNGQTPDSPVWADTANIPPRRRDRSGRLVPGQIILTIDFRDPVVRGTFLYHCHILDHEDQGMMAKIRVI